VLSFDRERAWMLMHDGGTMLRDLVRRVQDLEHWVAAVPLYAEVQLAATVRTDELLRIGVPDLRLGRLPSEFASLVERANVTSDERAALRRLVPRVEALCEELGQDEIGASLQHNDLHSHNVLFRDGRYRLFDWGDSSISHPFQTMRITLAFAGQAVGLPVESAALQRVRDAYLEPWAGLRSRQELLRSFALAQRVGGVSDVLTEDRTDTAAGIDPPLDDPRSIPSMLRGLLAEL
jgi:aminoglycoside phosphotransferase (APT) family kinase protein